MVTKIKITLFYFSIASFKIDELIFLCRETPYTCDPNNSRICTIQVPVKPVWPVTNTFLFFQKFYLILTFFFLNIEIQNFDPLNYQHIAKNHDV